jgi:hypothetical protein
MIPHSPYLLHSALGWAVSRLLNPEWGLSLLSTVANLAATALFAWTLRQQRFDPMARASAVAVYLLSPVALYQSGLQEIYATQSAFAMAAVALMHRDRSRAWLGSGIAYGAACLTHNGSLFLLPGMVYFLLDAHRAPAGPRQTDPDGGSIPTSRAAAETVAAGITTHRAALVIRWLSAAALTGAAGVGLLFLQYTRLFPGRALPMTVAALRGMSPLPRPAHTVYGWWESADRILTHLSLPMALGWPAAVLLLIAAAGLLLTRDRRRLLGWLLLVLPYVGYELSIGGTPDIGTYVVYMLPPFAVLAGEAQAALLRRLEPVRVRPGSTPPGASNDARPASIHLLAWLPFLVLLLLPAARYVVAADPPTWLEPEDRPGRALMTWVRHHTPADTLVLPAVPTPYPYDLGCWSARQAVRFYHEQDLRIVSTPAPGSSIEGPFLEPLTPEGLERRLRAGQWILALSADPFPGPQLVELRRGLGSHYIVRPCRAGSWQAAGAPLYRLALPEAPLEIACDR